MNPFIKKLPYKFIGLLILTITLLTTKTCVCTVTFADTAGNIAIDTTNSSMYINNPAKITGWGLRSVVKTYGDNASSAWPEGYNANAIVGLASQPNVTIATRTNLIDANSNAINGSGGSLLRTTSNLLLYVARTYSSSILVLNSRADSNNTNIRTTSNAINLFVNNLAAPTTDSIDGTQFMRYHTGHHVFHNNGNPWSIRGLVRFNDGFTVMPLASVIMDTLTTVSGAIDLRDTGTLILNNDLYLAHNVTLTNGGNIKGQASSSGQANTIFMGGDLTLAEDSYARTLHITGDWSNSGTSGNLIIDGCGHTLNIGNRAQIFVDQNITLTLRNMTIKTGPKSLNNPAIQLASFGSKLALDNVMFDLGADFHFITGQLFVHNEVAVTGTSAFVYQSPVPSYITSGATWSFEQATTFSVAPSTFTDCPFTVNNTYTNNAFLVLADASSALSLNGCSFQTTFTGLRLRSGMVLFDNKVAIDTTAGVDLNNTTPITEIGSGVTTGNYPIFAPWSPDGRFLAVITNTGNTLQIFRFNGNAVPTLVGTVGTGMNPYHVAWSPDGRFLAVANANSSSVQIYSFNGSNAPTSLVTIPTPGKAPISVAWSPDGRFLAATDNATATLLVFRFNGTSKVASLGTVETGGGPISVTWAPNGRFLALANHNSPYSLQVFRFNGVSAPTLMSTVTTGNTPYSVAWSPDGRFLANVNTGDNNVQIFRFNGSNQLVSVGTVLTGSAQPYSITWSPDGRFFMVTTYAGTSLEIFRFNGSSMPTGPFYTQGFGSPAYSASWSPDGNFIAVMNTTSPTGTLHVFRCNYYYTSQPAQGFSNGLLFGDKAKGAAFDANVQILAGATMKVKGKIKDDSF